MLIEKQNPLVSGSQLSKDEFLPADPSFVNSLQEKNNLLWQLPYSRYNLVLPHFDFKLYHNAYLSLLQLIDSRGYPIPSIDTEAFDFCTNLLHSRSPFRLTEKAALELPPGFDRLLLFQGMSPELEYLINRLGWKKEPVKQFEEEIINNVILHPNESRFLDLHSILHDPMTYEDFDQGKWVPSLLAVSDVYDIIRLQEAMNEHRAIKLAQSE
ncbi:MAG: hypothetical protein ACEQSA_01560 [Weeksellaceae bacterium]